VVTLCGGPPEAIVAEISLAISKGCTGIVSFGIAGGLDPELQPGTCIVARSIVTAQARFDSHPEWSSRLLKSIPGSIHADIAGVRSPVTTPADKRAMGLATGAAAVDMESILLVGAAAAHSLPFAAVRVVADPCHRALPPAALINLQPDGTPDLSAVMRSLMVRPLQISALIRIALDARTARAALTRSRRLLGPGFGFHDDDEALAVPAQ
jgi:adenosylhomocysteine nucleosidase